jgi:hypothetical protein
MENEKLLTAWNEYVAMRKKLKKPLTPYAERLAKKKLIELSAGDIEHAIEILDQSTFNCWLGLFPLKDKIKAINSATAELMKQYLK